MGLTTLSEEEHQLIDQALQGMMNAEIDALDAIYDEINNLEDEMRYMNETAHNETAWN